MLKKKNYDKQPEENYPFKTWNEDGTCQACVHHEKSVYDSPCRLCKRLVRHPNHKVSYEDKFRPFPLYMKPNRRRPLS